MSEDDAIARIEADCRTSDLEGNGCQLDSIMQEFLRSLGFARLADAIASVECWRA